MLQLQHSVKLKIKECVHLCAKDLVKLRKSSQGIDIRELEHFCSNIRHCLEGTKNLHTWAHLQYKCYSLFFSSRMIMDRHLNKNIL